MSVLLPQPLGPMIAVTLPGMNRHVTPSSATAGAPERTGQVSPMPSHSIATVGAGIAPSTERIGRLQSLVRLDRRREIEHRLLADAAAHELERIGPEPALGHGGLDIRHAGRIEPGP